MNGEVIDYKMVLEDLRIKRDRIDQAIAGLEAMLGESSSLGVSPIVGNAVEIHPDTFVGKTIVEGACMYLRMTGRPAKSTENITEALNRGGLRVAKESVSAILMRDANQGGEIYKIGRGVWGLTEWYSGVPKRGKKRGTEKEEGEQAQEGEQKTGVDQQNITVEKGPQDAA